MMDHAEAAKTYAVEQYLLGQLSEAEQDGFEEHFFSCRICAEDVKAGTAFVANLKQVFGEVAQAREKPATSRRGWWRGFGWPQWSFAPAAALAACSVLGVIAGYQNLVEIPRLRTQIDASAPLLGAAATVRVSAERAGESLRISKRNPVASLVLAHEWEETYSRYFIELRRQNQNGPVVAQSDIAATAGDLTISIRTSGMELGKYMLTVFGVTEGSSTRAPIGRVPLTLIQ